jgi:hypothetical protein
MVLGTVICRGTVTGGKDRQIGGRRAETETIRAKETAHGTEDGVTDGVEARMIDIVDADETMNARIGRMATWYVPTELEVVIDLMPRPRFQEEGELDE